MPTFTQIGSAVTVGSGGASSIEFTSIPATYTDLVLIGSVRSSASGNVVLAYRFNGSTSGYTNKALYTIDGSTTSSSSETTISVGAATYGRAMSGYIDGASQTSNTFTSFNLYVPNYAGSTNKSSSLDAVMENNATANTVEMDALLWSNTAAITSISIAPHLGSFVQYSTAYLYGVSNA